MPFPIPQSEGRAARCARALVVTTALLGLGACATVEGQSDAPVAEKPMVDVKRLVERGDKAFGAGALEAARAHYQLALQHDPQNLAARLGVAEIRLVAADHEGAREIFLSLQDEPTVAARAKQGIGLVHLREGEMRQAKQTLTEAVSMDPDLWRAWNGLGAVYDAEHDWTRSQESYSRAVAAAPDAASAAVVRNNIGFSLMLQGRYSDAVTALVTAARTDPNLEVARTNLRLALAWQGKYREAVAGALPEERPMVLSNVGYIALLRGDEADAETFITRAIDESPSHFQAAWLNLQHLKAARQDIN